MPDDTMPCLGKDSLPRGMMGKLADGTRLGLCCLCQTSQPLYEVIPSTFSASREFRFVGCDGSLSCAGNNICATCGRPEGTECASDCDDMRQGAPRTYRFYP